LRAIAAGRRVNAQRVGVLGLRGGGAAVEEADQELVSSGRLRGGGRGGRLWGDGGRLWLLLAAGLDGLLLGLLLRLGPLLNRVASGLLSEEGRCAG
jgi:hypothetical protein